MVLSAQINRILHKPLWLKTLIFVVLGGLLFIAWPLAVAAIYSLVVLHTMQKPKTRLALVAAMIAPALFMQFTWGQTIVANLQPAPTPMPSTNNQVASKPLNQPDVQGATTQPVDKVKVLQAVSGDTLDVDRDGQPYRVKLIGLQAPLMAAKSTGKAECFGPESQMFLDSLLRGRSIELRSDAAIGDGEQGLMARYIIMDDGTEVNQLMLEAGLARPDTQANYELSAQFKAYAEAAKAAKKGLWLNCDKPTTPTPTPPIKSTPTITPTSRPTIETTVTPINPSRP